MHSLPGVYITAFSSSYYRITILTTSFLQHFNPTNIHTVFSQEWVCVTIASWIEESELGRKTSGVRQPTKINGVSCTSMDFAMVPFKEGSFKS